MLYIVLLVYLGNNNDYFYMFFRCFYVFSWWEFWCYLFFLILELFKVFWGIRYLFFGIFIRVILEFFLFVNSVFFYIRMGLVLLERILGV